MEYFYLLTRSSFFIFRVLLCSPSFSYSRPFIINSPDNRYYYSQIWKWTFPRTAYEHGYNTYLSSSLYYLYFLRFINIITEFDSSFSPAAISFSLPFSSPFSFASTRSQAFKARQVTISSSTDFSGCCPNATRCLLEKSSLYTVY